MQKSQFLKVKATKCSIYLECICMQFVIHYKDGTLNSVPDIMKLFGVESTQGAGELQFQASHTAARTIISTAYSSLVCMLSCFLWTRYLALNIKHEYVEATGISSYSWQSAVSNLQSVGHEKDCISWSQQLRARPVNLPGGLPTRRTSVVLWVQGDSPAKRHGVPFFFFFKRVWYTLYSWVWRGFISNAFTRFSV